MRPINIVITGDPVVDNLKDRQEETEAEIKRLAYQRLQLTRQVEEIDKVIGQLEGAQIANGMVKKDIDLRETIAQAQKEAAEKRAAEAKLAEEAKNKRQEVIPNA